MPAYLRFRENQSIRTSSGEHLPVLGKPIAAGAALPIGAVQSYGPANKSCMCRIVVTEDCYVEIGDEDAAEVGVSDFWPAGTRDAEFVPAGKYVSVIAAA
ncbi:hypothetical protein GCM10009424_30610 [Sphingomonas ursincola]|uniref:Uncharacterized protein n=1 Tax=Sphingomonas ursincola TaxID=56361 RepID=A0A7V8U7P2_9SPHN|nr:hypothetical protein [Sphingomonas ursincola]MBA1373208.1 hypothetical protein [Sphingomonas ursincola]